MSADNVLAAQPQATQEQKQQEQPAPPTADGSGDPAGSEVELTEVVAAQPAEGDASAPKSESKLSPGEGNAAAGGDGAAPPAAAPTASPGKAKAIATPANFRRAGKNTAVLEWKDINFSVRERGKVKQILHGVSGTSAAGEMLALMGPSGAGKSSLLNILACRTLSTRSKSIEVTGKIMVNGVQVDPNTFRQQVAYVMQEDIMYAYQTPREVFRFSAKLRLPADRTVEERRDLVEWMITTLGLEACADTRIGNVKVQGISGGERKRTAIGVELITAPKILFLDEPTSGLDSYAAFNVVQVLTGLSAQGTTIIATIHQPSSETFELFRNTYLLAKGRTIFNQPTANMLPHFAALGHACPPQYNPADFVMFLMQKCTGDELTALADAWDAAHAAATAATAVGKQGATSLATITDAADDGVEGGKAGGAAPPRGSLKDAAEAAEEEEQQDVPPPNCCVQLGWLLQRAFVNFGRDYGSLVARLAITAVQNLLVALVFLGVGRGYADVPLPTFNESGSGAIDATETLAELGQVLNAHFGVLFFIAIGALFGLAQPLLLNFPTERPIFLREHAVGTYSAFPYFLSSMCVEIPVGILQMLLVYLLSYWTVGMNGNFGLLVLATALLGFVTAATAVLIGAVTSTVETAMQAAPLTFVPQILFAGFFIPISLIPEWLRWAQYLCALNYGTKIILILEFGSVPPSLADSGVEDALYYRAVYGCPTATTDCGADRFNTSLFPRNEIDPDDVGIYVGIMVGIFVLFRVIAALVLAARSRSST